MVGPYTSWQRSRQRPHGMEYVLSTGKLIKNVSSAKVKQRGIGNNTRVSPGG